MIRKGLKVGKKQHLSNKGKMLIIIILLLSLVINLSCNKVCIPSDEQTEKVFEKNFPNESYYNVSSKITDTEKVAMFFDSSNSILFQEGPGIKIAKGIGFLYKSKKDPYSRTEYANVLRTLITSFTNGHFYRFGTKIEEMGESYEVLDKILDERFYKDEYTKINDVIGKITKDDRDANKRMDAYFIVTDGLPKDPNNPDWANMLIPLKEWLRQNKRLEIILINSKYYNYQSKKLIERPFLIFILSTRLTNWKGKYVSFGKKLFEKLKEKYPYYILKMASFSFYPETISSIVEINKEYFSLYRGGNIKLYQYVNNAKNQEISFIEPLTLKIRYGEGLEIFDKNLKIKTEYLIYSCNEKDNEKFKVESYEVHRKISPEFLNGEYNIKLNLDLKNLNIDKWVFYRIQVYNPVYFKSNLFNEKRIDFSYLPYFKDFVDELLETAKDINFPIFTYKFLIRWRV